MQWLDVIFDGPSKLTMQFLQCRFCHFYILLFYKLVKLLARQAKKYPRWMTMSNPGAKKLNWLKAFRKPFNHKKVILSVWWDVKGPCQGGESTPVTALCNSRFPSSSLKTATTFNRLKG